MFCLRHGRDDQPQKNRAKDAVTRDVLTACLLERDQPDAGGLTLEWLIDRAAVEERLTQ